MQAVTTPSGPRASELLARGSAPAAHPVPTTQPTTQPTTPPHNAADVIIVGAGPGGAAAAITLARRGISVLLLEKSNFPREKVCGDGLTPRAVRMLGRLGVDLHSGWVKNRGLSVFGAHQRQFDFDWPSLHDFPDFGMVCRREILDDLLAGHAIAAGAQLITDAGVKDVIRNEKGTITGVRTASGAEYRAHVVIAADGNASATARAAGISARGDRPMAVAVRAYFESPLTDLDRMQSWLDLSGHAAQQGAQLPGYGWIFGMGDGTVNVGVGMLNSTPAFRNTDYRDLLRRWIATLPPEWQLDETHRVSAIRGAALPMCLDRTALAVPNLLLVGDAAGLVSPFNGEGISYAMESGEIAADVITAAATAGFGSPVAKRALQTYSKRLRAAVGGYYRLGTVFTALIGRPGVMRVCTTYGLPNQRLMKLIHKLLANLTDHPGGDLDDRVINALSRIAPDV